MSRKSWQQGLAVFGLSVLSLAGCSQSGPQLGKVEGEVRLDGKPLVDAIVEFQPTEQGSPSIGVTDDEGRFELRFSKEKWGALVGAHIVKIDQDVDGREGITNGVVIPSRYNAQSELQRDVEPGTNFYEFDLQTGIQTVSSSR